MNNIEDLTKRIIAFRDARDWKQFHNSKDVALSLVLEAAEVMEHLQWKSKKEIEKYIKTNKAEISESKEGDIAFVDKTLEIGEKFKNLLSNK